MKQYCDFEIDENGKLVKRDKKDVKFEEDLTFDG